MSQHHNATLRHDVLLTELDTIDELTVLGERLQQVAAEYPVLARFLCQLAAKLEHAPVVLDDLKGAIRLYHQSPVVFELLADILTLIHGEPDSDAAVPEADERSDGERGDVEPTQQGGAGGP